MLPAYRRGAQWHVSGVEFRKRRRRRRKTLANQFCFHVMTIKSESEMLQPGSIRSVLKQPGSSGNKMKIIVRGVRIESSIDWY